MPIYTMKCQACDHEQDIFRKLAEIDDDLPKHCRQRMVRKITAPAVHADLPAYQAIAVDQKTGTVPVIEGRSQHREYLKRNGYSEVGNDMPTAPRELKGDFNLRKELTDATRQVLAKHH